jgi:hypothetical protein
MKNIYTIISRLALVAIVGFAFASCTTEDTVGTNPGPTGLMARSDNASTISLKWTRASGDIGPDTVVITGGSTAIAPVVVSAAASTAVINGLTNGPLYSFTVHGNGGASTALQWMTAVRTNGVKIYQYSSTGASGLALNVNGTATPISVDTTNDPSVKSKVDFILDDNIYDSGIPSPPGLSFESANFVFRGGNGLRKSTLAPAAEYVVGGLDADWASTSYSAAMSGQGTNYDLSEEADYDTKGSPILLAHTPEGNFAKIEIVPDPTSHKLYSGSGFNKYITVNVSYQPTPNQPYAGRPH